MYLALTPKLKDTKCIIQTGHQFELDWGEIKMMLYNDFLNNYGVKDEAAGFSLKKFKSRSQFEWRKYIYDIYIDLEESLQSYSGSNYRTMHYKWSKINTEEKRLNLINSNLYGDNAFRRKSSDCILGYGLIIDYDNGLFLLNTKNKNKIYHDIPLINPQEVIKKFCDLNIEFCAYSSFNNSHNHPKFRIVIPFDSGYSIKDNQYIKMWYINNFSFRKMKDFIWGLVDNSSFEFSRFFYVPINNNETKKWFYHNEGKILSVEEIIKTTSEKKFDDPNFKSMQYVKAARKRIIQEYVTV